MRSRRLMWILLSLLCLAGTWLLWQGRDARLVRPDKMFAAPVVTSVHSLSTAPQFLATASTNAAKTIAAANTNKFAYRLNNTTKSIDQLLRDDKAILLENALIDTRSPLNLSIPANLRAQGEPGAYIVQARGPINGAFRAMLAQAGATIVSYIPNDAYLVRISQGSANGLAGNPLTQSVIPYEPYYKISSSMPVTVGQRTVSSTSMETHRAAGPSLLALAVKQAPLPAGTYLTLGLFSDSSAATVAQIEKLGGQVFAQDRSPFGPIVRVVPPKNWTALAALSGVQRVEPYHKRASANDLSRVTVGVSTNTTTANSYMGLTGQNVMVEVNDTGIDATHPDLSPRVIGDAVQSLVDTNGHGTHVAGIIASSGVNGKKPPGPTDVGAMAQGSESGADFRGKAPLAMLYSVGGIEGGSDTNVITDRYFQEAPARTNALISNNSWNYGDSSYDLAAASYDAAVRDALPEVTGSQPVLFVFAAGNDGNGDNDGGGGSPDTILSPATAKNVITVGALEQLRNITNAVTNLDGSIGTPWSPMTDTSNEVASYSSRGNVGIGFEGSFGRYKPDVVAPGTFVVSTRSEQWDENAYYNPTNIYEVGIADQVSPGSPNEYQLSDFGLSVPNNAVSVMIQILPNNLSPADMPIYVSLSGFPDPNVPSSYTPPDGFMTAKDNVTIPPDGPAGYLTQIINNPGGNGDFYFTIADSTNQPVNYDLLVQITTTNDLGNYFEVLSNLNETIGPWYRYETGTSMAAADVSGVLALMQDYFTNTLHATPSPALLKAMLINGARPTFFYDFQVQKTENPEGWGLINLPSALQPGITNRFTAPCSTFVLEQNPTNALATGDSQTFHVTATNTQPLRITLAWTDPPGDPAAAIKLVNDLNLVVTNLDDPASPIVYYGNDIASGYRFNKPGSTNAPNFDSINNIENVYLSNAGTNFSVTVVGYRVNVNAVTAQTNNFTGAYAPNVVQDYALVISSGDGLITDAMTVTATPIVSNPTGDQQITYMPPNSGTLLNQFVGANTPLMGTNTLLLTNSILVSGETNWQITIGMTNQWHFYVVTNNTTNANAAFVTYNPDTLSIPRMGVFESTVANATRPEADIDLYVSTDSGLTNLVPAVINGALTNAMASLNGTNSVNTSATAAGIYEMASLGRGGTEFVVDTNSQPGEVYYVGVKSEDQMASEYAFLSVFSATPFSQINGNGDQIVTGVGVPVAIPGGNSAVPGYVDVIAIAIYPIPARRVVITNTFNAQDFGDLVGAVNHNDTSVILNNHDSPYAPGIYTFIYDDSGQGDIISSQPSDGPGTLRSYTGQEGAGVWILHEANNVGEFANAVDGFNLTIQPHRANNGTTITTTVAGGAWYYDYIDVPPGATNLTITVTNLTASPSPLLELFVKYGAEPTLTSYDKKVGIINVDSLGLDGSISIGLADVPPLTSGRYFFGVYNPSASVQTVSITTTYYMSAVPGQVDFTSTGPVPILDDAVTYSTRTVSDDATISSVDVGLRVDHSRISDLVFHLISPDGTRVLLMENRGGTSTNGCGSAYNTMVTNISISGSGLGLFTNVIDTGQTNGTLIINYGFQNAGGDEMWVFDQGNNQIFHVDPFYGFRVSPSIPYGGTGTQVTIVIKTLSPGGWNCLVDVFGAKYAYLVLTDNTNRTTTPIKFAPPPFTTVAKNITLLSGAILSPINNHYYYLLGPDTWTGSEASAEAMGGYLTTVRSQSENGWIYNTFDAYQFGSGWWTEGDDWWIGLYDTNMDFTCGSPPNLICHSNNFGWVSGEKPVPYYRNWAPSEPNNAGGQGYYTVMAGSKAQYPNSWLDKDNTDLLGAGNPHLICGIAELDSPAPPIADLYYLPEQSLDAFAGKNAQGQWQLEVLDNRAGASNNATLVSWQLRFNFANSTPVPTVINTNSAFTNFIAPGGIAYYLVEVPTNASYATNILIFATGGPLNIWFSTNSPPTITNSAHGDFNLIPNSIGNSLAPAILFTNTASWPYIVPYGIYYLGVQNTNSVTVNYGLEVDFDNATGMWPQAFSISGASVTSSGTRLQWTASPDERFLVEWATNLSLPMIWMTNADVITSSNGTFMFTDPGATNSPMRFYRLLQLP